ncbi:hypothetical protein GN956_G7781 [Arapaima gigas]
MCRGSSDIREPSKELCRAPPGGEVPVTAAGSKDTVCGCTVTLANTGKPSHVTGSYLQSHRPLYSDKGKQHFTLYSVTHTSP